MPLGSTPNDMTPTDTVPDPLNSEEYESALTERAELQHNIAGMEAALEDRYDQPWRNRCLYNLKRAHMRLNDVNRKIDQMEHVSARIRRLAELDARNAAYAERLKLEKEAREKKIERHAAQMKIHAERKAILTKAKMEAQFADELLVYYRFKKLVKAEIGLERYVQLIEQASREAEHEAGRPLAGQPIAMPHL